MHLWLTCYFARQRGRGGSATDGSPSMLSEGYLIAGPPKPRKKKPGTRVRVLSRGERRVSALSTGETMPVAAVLRSPGKDAL